MSLYISPEQLDLIVHALEFAAAASYEDDAFTTKQRQYMQQLADKLTDLQPDYFPNCDVSNLVAGHEATNCYFSTL